ncbi:MAG: hypothetical protein DM484_27815 [Candidatus Methylumidiphilus alinenensis]|uniref:Uncharacterized protein n=1 Tax=Candidatus Methylumidiphilus alinenensis TaxID=2202197 RepID=A0A2W4QFH9_9GAMM|nr:MAG: hypothetical protein DM484_27815 [Candidatus Methylumidiphilus alinenensis]
MNTFKLTSSKRCTEISKRLFGLLALIGLLPAPAVEAAINIPLIQRTEDIRQRLLDADKANTKSHPQQQGPDKNENLASGGWYNFPNFPNWGKWRDWRNY